MAAVLHGRLAIDVYLPVITFGSLGMYIFIYEDLVFLFMTNRSQSLCTFYFQPQSQFKRD